MALNVLRMEVFDTDTICAALLHDTIDVGKADKVTIKKQFGDNIYTLVEGVTKISDNCFYNCLQLTNITLPSSLKQIGWNAFSNNSPRP